MMTRETTRATLKEILIRALRIDDMTVGELSDDQPLLDGDLSIDSIDILQLILEIEQSFKIKLVTGEFARGEWKTLDTLATAIETKVREQATVPAREP